MSRSLDTKAVLRQLLRVIRNHLTHQSNTSQYKDHVLGAFRANAGTQEPGNTQQLLLVAKEYADLAANIHHHQELLQRYNIGKDPDERDKEMVRKTAARVGFELPQPRDHSSQQQQESLKQQNVQQDKLPDDKQQECVHQQVTGDGLLQRQQHKREGSEQQHQRQQQDETVVGSPQLAAPSMAYAQRLQGGGKMKS